MQRTPTYDWLEPQASESPDHRCTHHPCSKQATYVCSEAVGAPDGALSWYACTDHRNDALEGSGAVCRWTEPLVEVFLARVRAIRL